MPSISATGSCVRPLSRNHRYSRIPQFASLIAFAASAALLAQCGSSAPGESDAKQAVQGLRNGKNKKADLMVGFFV
jgi:hypothetical protein